VLSRRHLLQGAVALLAVRDALAQGRVERGVYRVRGDVRMNGEPAREGAQVRAGDSITTGAEGEMVFVVNRDAMLVRRNSNVSLLADGLRAVTGAVLSVFASGQRKQIVTGTAVIGIRGTGVYVEAEQDRSYVCACYGEVTLEPIGDPRRARQYAPRITSSRATSWRRARRR
jgi:hypothetical protein